MGCWFSCRKKNNSKSIITTNKKPTEAIIPYSNNQESIEATKEDNKTPDNQEDPIEKNSKEDSNETEQNQEDRMQQEDDEKEVYNMLEEVEKIIDEHTIEKTDNNISKYFPESTTSSGQDDRQEQEHNQDNKVKSNSWIQLIKKLIQKLKLKPKSKLLVHRQINKFKTNIKSFIRPIDELEKELEELITKQNICEELLKERIREKSNQGFSHLEGLDERYKELVRKYKYKYKYKDDEAIHESIEKREFRIVILQAVIHKKKEKIKKQIDKLTKEIKESADFQKELEATTRAKMKENIFPEGLEEEEKKLLNKYENRTSEQIESMIRDKKSLIRKKTEEKEKLEQQLNSTTQLSSQEP